MSQLTCKKLLLSLATSLLFLVASTSVADNERITSFPLENYSQTIADWIKPNDPSYDKPLLSANLQQKHFALFYDRYYGISSPWSERYINKVFLEASSGEIKTILQTTLTYFDNQDKEPARIGYGVNYQPHPENWITKLTQAVNLDQFTHLVYRSENRAIATNNLLARVLPTDDVHFYSHQIPGQGYPFDNLQTSSLWAGTPVYILGETVDRAWMLVVTPEYIAWVKSRGIARASNGFIDTWQHAAKKQLAAITTTKTSIIDGSGQFRFLGYVGSVFPVMQKTNDGLKILIPVKNNEQRAAVRLSTVSMIDATIMPLPATPRHFALIMATLVGRPYGWGNMYFYNDCSAELKSLFTPFGIWLPRNSGEQERAGAVVDMTVATPEKRLSYLLANGHPFLTLVYVGGHVVLYLGKYTNEHSPEREPMAMTYQNVWGFVPKDGSTRVVIGKSAFLPMLLQFPQSPELLSQAGKKVFKVIYLDDLSQLPDRPQQDKERRIFDLKSLIFPSYLPG